MPDILHGLQRVPTMQVLWDEQDATLHSEELQLEPTIHAEGFLLAHARTTADGFDGIVFRKTALSVKVYTSHF